MLSARFHALRDRTLAAVDRAFAEPVRLSFFKDGALDPSRPAIEIEAVLRTGGGKETMVSGNRSDKDWRSRIAAQRGELHIDRARYPVLVVRQGDKVKALARPGEPWSEVLAVEDRGLSRLVLQLGEV
ncbi:hypothetical protein MAUB1S_09705 [Mycolicibacterium aubagnense]